MARALPHSTYARERHGKWEKHVYFAIQSVFTVQIRPSP